MSPFKKIINRITGRQETDSSRRRRSRFNPLRGRSDPLRGRLLRAFGKLPVSREFLHLEAGQGAAKLVQDWIKSGHDSWVRRFDVKKRGQIAPSCMFTTIPASRDRAVVGCIWNSRDNASPPRAFPFSLFLVQSPAAHDDWVGQFLICDNYWNQLVEIYDAMRTEEIALQDLQGHQLAPMAELNRHVGDVADAAGRLDFQTWVRAILPTVRSDDPIAYLQFLYALVHRWSEHAADGGAAIRLPLSRAFPYRVQVAVWLQWLAAHLDSSPTRLAGLVVPQNVPEAEPTITVATRPMTELDFQLLTTNAAEYEQVEDATQPQIPVDREDRGNFDRQLRELLDSGKSLWQWAKSQGNALPSNATSRT